MMDAVRWRYHAVGTVLVGAFLVVFQTVFRDGADVAFVVSACILYFAMMTALDVVRSHVEENA